MKRFLLIVLFLLLAFYVAWPAVSLWQMYSSVRAGDAEMLKRKVDFRSVRASMSPAVEAKIAQHVEKLKHDGGTAGAIVSGVMGTSMARDVAKVVLDHLVTAENIIRMSREPGTLSDKIDRAVTRTFGSKSASATRGVVPAPGPAAGTSPGGDGQPNATRTRSNADQPTQAVAESEGRTSPKGEPPQFGFGNLKGFRVVDPLVFEIDVAKDAASPTADATAQLSFQGFDWKLTGVVPHPK